MHLFIYQFNVNRYYFMHFYLVCHLFCLSPIFAWFLSESLEHSDSTATELMIQILYFQISTLLFPRDANVATKKIKKVKNK